MKRLILIQNDFPGAGKTTLAECLHHYLQNYRVSHHRTAIVEASDPRRQVSQLEAGSMKLPHLITELDRSDLVIAEVETGFGEFFGNFYKRHELDLLLPELGFELSVLIPVTSDRESFDGVTFAAETYSDSAQYLVVHTPTSSFYDEDERAWDRSYAARIMDMFEAADLDMPACPESLEVKLCHHHTELPEAVNREIVDTALRDEMTKWFRRVASQLDTARTYVFGDTFRPAIAITPPPAAKRRGRPAKAKAETIAA